MSSPTPYVHWPPGLRRQDGGGWVYDNGDPVNDRQTLSRLRALAIPPAWRHVWASDNPGARVQARGIDSRGRVQYRYSKEATEQAARDKFEHTLHYAEQLPEVHAAVLHQLARRPEEPDIDQVTALAVRFLNLGLFRVGNERYVQDNHTYGLTTLERRHVSTKGSVVSFDFIGKEHLRQVHQVNDRPAARITKKLLARTPSEDTSPLFVVGSPSPHRVDSAAVNTFIHAIGGGASSAKVARTWGATVIAAAVVAGAGFDSPNKHRDPSLRAFDAASHVLGNTPTMAKNSYVHPGVLAFSASERVQEAVAGSVERMGDDDATRIFVDEELQAAVLSELRAQRH